MRNLRLALRTLRRSPGFSAAVTLTLALGIGANTAMFRAIDHALLRPLPYPEPDRLVALHETQTGKGFRPVSLPNLLDWRAQTTTFEAVAGYMRRSFGLRRGAEPPIVIQAGMTTSDLFRVLGKAPLIGRSFTETEEIQGARVIVLTDALWARAFGRNPAVVGSTTLINDEPRVVVGVLPPDFDFAIQGDRMDAFIPLDHADYGKRVVRPLEAIARLKPGVSRDVARTELAAVGARLAQAWPEDNHLGGADLESLDDAWKGSARKPLWLLECAALLLAAIGLTNVVNLMLARALARRRDTAIRVSLGATVGQLVRESLAESLVLSAIGGALAIAAAAACLRFVPLVAARFGDSVRLSELGSIGLDASAIGVAIAGSIGAGVVCGLLSVLLSRTVWRGELVRASGAAASLRGQVRVRRALVAAQVGASLILLLSAGLFLRVFVKLATTHPGFESAQVYYFGFGLPEARYDDRRTVDFHRQLTAKLAAIPGVESVGLAWRLPLNGRNLTTSFQFEGAGLPVTEWAWVGRTFVDPGYFETLRIPLLSGRNFSWSVDLPERPGVIIVNRTFERLYGKAVGRRVQMGRNGTLVEIVGVVADAYQMSLDKPVRPQFYVPVTQAGLDGGDYMLRTARTDNALSAEVAKAVESVDSGLERIQLHKLDGWVRESLRDRRTGAALTAAFAGVALLLTAIGLYGVVAFEVEQRRHEIAVRMALGADGGAVRRMVMRQGLALVAAGTVVGGGAFAWFGGLLRSQLYGVEPYDPAAIALVAAVLIAFAAAACEGPSRRAVRTDPMRLLR
ncbi:MAG: ABC transporter permease [Acidobacteria bacterium]|nr:ABC transporter permease [Acidobacteriota bacterium]